MLRISALMSMLLWAFSVRLVAAVGLAMIGLLIRMLPASVPPPVVSSTTLVLALSALAMSVAPIVEVPDGVNPGPPPLLVSPVPATTVMSNGSISQVPPAPSGADTSGVVSSTSCPRLDVSTKPPSPPPAPPRAEIAPIDCVTLSDQIVIVPPLPWSSASARTMLPGASVVVVAVAMLPSVPRRPPPMATLPPPEVPDASITAVSVTLTRVAVTWMRPPTPLMPRASTVPAICADAPPSIETLLPSAPEAMVRLRAVRVTDCVALKTMAPSPPIDAEVANAVPSWRMSPAQIPI